MNSLRRWKKMTAGLLAASLIAAGCGSVSSEGAPDSLALADDELVEIEWYVGLGTGTQQAQLEGQQKLVEAFNAEQSDIQIKLEVVDQRIAFDELQERLAEGDGPDLVGPLGIRGANAFEGQFLDLTGYLDEETLSLYDPEQVAVWERDGRTEALPFGVFPSMIFYNKEIFDDAGLPYPPAEFGGTYQGKPWDMDALTELSARLTVDANGNTSESPDFNSDIVVQWGFSHQWLDESRSHGAFFGSGTLEAEDGSAQIPDNWRAEWNWLHENTYNAHVIPSIDQANTELLNSGNLFSSGRVAMVFSHLWYTGSMTDVGGNPVRFWDIAATPTYNGEITSKLHADTFRVLAQTDHPDESFEVLSYLLGEGAEDLLQVYGSFPARTDLRQAFVDGLSERYPQVENWRVVDEALQYPDIPSHEAPLPGGDESQKLLDEFETDLTTDPTLDVDARVDRLEEALDATFVEPGD